MHSSFFTINTLVVHNNCIANNSITIQNPNEMFMHSTHDAD